MHIIRRCFKYAILFSWVYTGCSSPEFTGETDAADDISITTDTQDSNSAETRSTGGESDTGDTSITDTNGKDAVDREGSSDQTDSDTNAVTSETEDTAIDASVASDTSQDSTETATETEQESGTLLDTGSDTVVTTASEASTDTSVQAGTDTTIAQPSDTMNPTDTADPCDNSECCHSEDCLDGQSCVDYYCVCNQGTKLCIDTCIPENQCCDASECADGADCIEGGCVCPEATHLCDLACVSDLSSDHCGASCEPCLAPTGGTVSCDGTQCVPECPENQAICVGECIPVDQACTGVCPEGSHNCSDMCTPNDSVNGCGESCIPCEVPANGYATCDGTTCGFECNDTYRGCNDECIAQDECCSSSECPGDTECIDKQCACPAGQKRCGDSCVALNACCDTNECAGELQCIDNTCGCPANLEQCGNLCLTDVECCDQYDCSGELECINNTCDCPGTLEQCGDLCITTAECCSTSECAGELQCIGNQCDCPTNLDQCGNLCLTSSECCSTSECGGELQCIDNQCGCPSGYTRCGTTTDCAPSTTDGCCSNNDCDPGESCSSDNLCVDTLPPSVQNASPYNGQGGVTANQNIVLTFSEPMNTSSVQAAYSSSDLTASQVAFSWNAAGTVLTINPNASLQYATGTNPNISARSYTITINTAARDLAGNSMAANFNLTFTTLKRITQSIAARKVYRLSSSTPSGTDAVSGADCYSDDNSVRIGRTSAMAWSGRWRGIIDFGFPSAPSGLYDIESATIYGSQLPPDTEGGDPYDTGGDLLLQQVPYNTDPDYYTFHASAILDFGEFATSASVTTPSDSVLPLADAAFVAGGSDILLRLHFSDDDDFSGSVGAFFDCGAFRIDMVYLTQ